MFRPDRKKCVCVARFWLCERVRFGQEPNDAERGLQSLFTISIGVIDEVVIDVYASVQLSIEAILGQEKWWLIALQVVKWRCSNSATSTVKRNYLFPRNYWKRPWTSKIARVYGVVPRHWAWFLLGPVEVARPFFSWQCLQHESLTTKDTTQFALYCHAAQLTVNLTQEKEWIKKRESSSVD